ncbi:MAG: hypothetical protein MUE99_07950 [Chitinophagaceae bacterium]|nr:hypothetical protein [Chitinophagaceae bacterium]
MKILLTFWLFVAVTCPVSGQGMQTIHFEIFGDYLTVEVPEDLKVPFDGALTAANLKAFHKAINKADYRKLVAPLLAYRSKNNLNDWLYYQLVRKTAQQIAPKQENYYRYTLYKWFLMVKSGYDATLNIFNDQLLFYVYSNDAVYDIPLVEKNGKQYVCLNIHDYIRGTSNVQRFIEPVDLNEPLADKPFSYKVTRLPEFSSSGVTEKDVVFPYGNRDYHFKLKVNPQVQQIFTNYPTVEYETYFNIPLSKQTYVSLVPLLRENVKGMSVKKGVDYLMKFTRYGFLYEDDQVHFGKEKRMAPEETLLSSASDCDDRAALFFYLVKEIYDLPMVALVYTDHITVAIQFKKSFGQTITYNGNKYTVCEPTPQKTDLSLGKLSPGLRQKPYQVVYAYDPLH